MSDSGIYNHKARIGEGNSRREWSEESRAKISVAQKGRKHPDCSEATRKKIGDAHRGKTLSPEQIEILKRPKSESHRRKLSESSPNIQSWIVTPFGGEPMKIENLANFCRENNLGKANMLKVSQGKAKSCKGWTCEKAMVS